MLLLLPAKKAIVLIDPFRRDRRSDVTKNFLRWYQDEVKKRFSNDPAFDGLDTTTWRVIVASTDLFNSIFTPIQTDGWSCGVLCAMIAYHYIMYGELPSNAFFTCKPDHVTEMRLFMIYEIARLASLPANWTAEEAVLYNGTVEQRKANKSARIQRAIAQRDYEQRQVDNSVLNRALDDLDQEFKDVVFAEEGMKVDDECEVMNLNLSL